MLRVFFLGVLTPGQARDYLTCLADLSAREHADLAALADTIDWGEDGLSVGRIALEYGLRFNAMRRDWAEWAATQIE
ncbi:hypothetical protein [Kitasatospora sp. NPDC085464]|uniref:hypothetical protein n=1 Tax=Kitasatospora sp. NPDC085464 TaxID=3364063 RepID=UPI0037CA9C94